MKFILKKDKLNTLLVGKKVRTQVFLNIVKGQKAMLKFLGNTVQLTNSIQSYTIVHGQW